MKKLKIKQRIEELEKEGKDKVTRYTMGWRGDGKLIFLKVGGRFQAQRAKDLTTEEEFQPWKSFNALKELRN